MFDDGFVLEAVEQLTVAAEECAAGALWPLSEADLLQFLDGVHRVQQVLHAAILHAVRQVDGRGIPRAQQVATANMWLRQRLRISPTVAAQLLSQAELIDSDPQLDAAVTAGQVNAEQLNAICQAHREIPRDVDADTRKQAGQVLLDWVPALDPVQLRRAGRRILEHVAPDAGDADEEARLRRAERNAREQRFLTLSPAGDGRVRLRGILDSESAGILTAAIDPLCKPEHVAAELAATGEARTPGQRRADALIDVCRLALAEGRLPDNGGDRPQLALTAPFDVLKQELGPGQLDTGDPVSAETVRRLACEARILPFVFDGDSQILDAGRSRRLVGGVQRRALIVRDRGCTFPGCDRPARWCDAHHMTPWSQDGTTDLSEVALLCGYHHQVIHSDTGWEIRPGPGGRPEFLPPARVDPQRAPRTNGYHRRT